VSPEAYQDAPTRAPYDPGTYTFKIVKVSLRRDKTGQLRTNNGFPVLCLEQVEILEPSERAGDKVFLYQDIRTKPFERKGPKARRWRTRHRTCCGHSTRPPQRRVRWRFSRPSTR